MTQTLGRLRFLDNHLHPLADSLLMTALVLLSRVGARTATATTRAPAPACLTTRPTHATRCSSAYVPWSLGSNRRGRSRTVNTPHGTRNVSGLTGREACSIGPGRRACGAAGQPGQGVLVVVAGKLRTGPTSSRAKLTLLPPSVSFHSQSPMLPSRFPLLSLLLFSLLALAHSDPSTALAERPSRQRGIEKRSVKKRCFYIGTFFARIDCEPSSSTGFLAFEPWLTAPSSSGRQRGQELDRDALRTYCSRGSDWIGCTLTPPLCIGLNKADSFHLARPPFHSLPAPHRPTLITPLHLSSRPPSPLALLLGLAPQTEQGLIRSACKSSYVQSVRIQERRDPEGREGCRAGLSNKGGRSNVTLKAEGY